MKPSIQIQRFPYEEPHHLHLRFSASNADFAGAIEIYLNATELLKWADELEAFPRHKDHVFLFDYGSERKEDRWAYYFRFRAFCYSSSGRSALHFRLNTNSEMPNIGISEFCITTEAARINHLGRLLREFARLEHVILDWDTEDGRLYKTESKE
ncbi:hypothetical protein IMCC26134_04825 [Verrucomicrobia bacterium IMCC26134]|nr:hypothetical protein IMCC26134_04825 [Verrucomicrobia bacterium IMCC26134]